MDTQYLNINDVLIDDSQFSVKDYLFESFHAPTCHITSFDTLGILYPVIVYADDKKRYHLVDGRKRVQFAKEMREPRIRASILPMSTPVTDIITLIFCNKRNEIESSIMNKVQFLCFAMALNASESWILQSLCIPFEFKPHREFFRECERIYNLPEELKLFCHDKSFSLKQLLNLTYYPKDLLVQLITWKSDLQFTASTLDEIASNLKNYLKRENKNIIDFLSEPDIQELFDSSLSPRDKTEKLRQLIYLKRFPTLSETNARIFKNVKSLNLPREINIKWDRTLENKMIDISIHIKDQKHWQKLLDTLNSLESKNVIQSILDEL